MLLPLTSIDKLNNVIVRRIGSKMPEGSSRKDEPFYLMPADANKNRNKQGKISKISLSQQGYDTFIEFLPKLDDNGNGLSE